MRAVVIALVLASGLAGSMPALAQSGEAVRLKQDLQTRVEKTQWKAADRVFRDLEAMAAEDGDVLTAADWRLGATVARSVGDMKSVQRRLQAAFDLAPDDALREELQGIAATYGPVKIEVAAGFSGEVGLKATPPPFEPDKRAFIAAAAERLEAERTFDGLVPIGRYVVAGKEIEVTTGAIDTLRVRIDVDGGATLDRVRPGGPTEAPGLEWHVSVGAGVGALTQASRGVQPEPFGGVGVRVAGGVDVWLAPRLGLRFELGYLGLVGGGGQTLDGGVSLPGDRVHQGTAWLGGTWRAGPLDVAVGPFAALGSAAASGLDGEAWAARCADTPQDATCRGLEQASAEDLAQVSLRGRLLGLGGAAGASWEISDKGPIHPAISLTGGALSDGRRLQPWAQLGLTIRL